MNASQLANVAGALFILPFFLFSATAGQLADKYEKSRLIRAVKVAEIVLMMFAGYAFMSGQYALLLLVLFLMGCQSTMFGPVKLPSCRSNSIPASWLAAMPWSNRGPTSPSFWD